MPLDVFGEMREKADHPEWLDAASASNFIAWMNKGTHFCCVPGFKTSPQNAKFEDANEVYCPVASGVRPEYARAGDFRPWPTPDRATEGKYHAGFPSQTPATDTRSFRLKKVFGIPNELDLTALIVFPLFA